MAPEDVDPEDDIALPEAKKARTTPIFFGSLENVEKERLLKQEEAKLRAAETGEDGKSIGPAGGPEDDLAAGIASGNINVGANETMELDEEDAAAKEKQAALLREFQQKRRERDMAVPTADAQVRTRLRELGQPVTLFGEREMERRARLRKLLAEKQQADEEEGASESSGEEGSDDEEEDEDEVAELFYTEGSTELMRARGLVAEFSLMRSKQRLDRARRRREDPDEDEDAEAAAAAEAVGSITTLSSGWSGVAKIWNIPSCTQRHSFPLHSERITHTIFYPGVDGSTPGDSPGFASGSADKTAKLWSLKGKELQAFKGHLDRLGRIGFHPSGRFLGTSSFDKTWRLWDVETGAELLLQEGHSRAVYAVAFQDDGGLAASCGLDVAGRVWDLRTGRNIMVLEGHTKSVLCADFSPNGYHLVTGSEDNTARVWDMRKSGSLYVIPAHTSLVSQAKFEDRDGYFLITSSHDKSIKVWSGQDFSLLRVMVGHENKVMSCDVAPDGQYLASVSYDRTLKLWGMDRVTTDTAMF
eukprot:jgi/Mesvir1/24334/Mv11015-RA.1